MDRLMPPGNREDLFTAAHELGHGFVREGHGADVDAMTVYKFWGGGVCTWRLDNPPTDRIGQEVVLSGCLAGYVAEDRFRIEHGCGPADYSVATLDLVNFRDWQEFFGITMTEDNAISLAKTLLEPIWETLLEFVPVLAKKGRLPGAAIA